MSFHASHLVPLELGLSASVQLDLSVYFQDLDVDVKKLCRADIVVALLRINTRDTLRAAEELVGRPIKRCPPALPPWPPKPVAAKPSEPRVVRIARNPLLPTTKGFQHFRGIKKGMTRAQLKARGVPTRDLNLWIKNNHVEFA